MSRNILILVVLFTIIFSGLTMSIFNRTDSLTSKIVEKSVSYDVGNLSASALQWAIQQVKDNNVEDDLIQRFNDIDNPEFPMLNGFIDSISYDFTFGDTKDTIDIYVDVNWTINGEKTFDAGRVLLARYDEELNACGHWMFGESNWDGVSWDVSDDNNSNRKGRARNGVSWDNTEGEYPFLKYGYFDGSDDYVEIDAQITSDYENEMTVGVWVNGQLPWWADESQTGVVVSEYSGSDENLETVWSLESTIYKTGFFFYTYWLEMSFRVQTSTGYESVTIQLPGTKGEIYDWHYATASYDGSDENNPSILIGLDDFTYYDESAISSRWQGHSAENNMSIGGRYLRESDLSDGRRCYHGKLAGVGIWKYALNEDKRKLIRNRYGSGMIPISGDSIFEIIMWRDSILSTLASS